MWLVEVGMCYADNSANTTLQCKTGKKHHFPTNYLRMIQLATELDTVVTKSVAQYPSSLCCITQKGVPQSRTRNTYSTTDGSSLAENYFLLTIMEFLNSKYFHVHDNILDHNDDYFVYTNTFVTSDAE